MISWRGENEEQIVDNFSDRMLKTVAFIAGKKNPAIQKNLIQFSIEIKLKKGFQR